ncbi:MAG: AAA family ATPase [Endomicrobiales bacterium]|jgi:chromosome partitioning protein
MKIIAITNQKGGTGKTATAMNLGAALASLGKKILLIDIDPQSNLTYSFGISPQKGTLADVLQTSQTLQSILVEKEGLFIAPSTTKLADVEVSLVNKIGRERFLKDKIKDLKGFDYVFIDCPPSLSVLTINALNVADEILIPVQMEILSLQGLSLLMNTIKEVRQILNKGLKINGIIPFMYDARRKLSEEVLAQIKTNLKEEYVYHTYVRECVKIAESPSFAQSVLKYAPQSHGGEDFINLAKEFLKRSK